MIATSSIDLINLCGSISKRAEACEAAANDVAGRDEQHVLELKAVSSGLEELKRRLAELEELLHTKPDSRKLRDTRETLTPLFTIYETVLEVLRMQLASWQPENTAGSDSAFLKAHEGCLVVYNYMLEVCTPLVRKDESFGPSGVAFFTHQAQEAVKPAMNQRLGKAGKDTALKDTMSSSEKVPAAEKEVAPPSYPEPVSTTTSLPIASQSTSSSLVQSPVDNCRRPKGSSFFRALTSGFRKHDPLVSTLCQAAARGDEQQVSGLITQGGNVNGRNEDGDTPLKCAIRYDQVGTARILLQAGAQSNKLPPLFKAASVGSLKVARMLIDSGESVHDKSKTGKPYFVDVVAKATWTNERREEVIVQVVKTDNIEITRLLLAHGANASAKDAIGEEIIVYAVKKGNVELANILLDHGADPNAESAVKQTILYTAVQSGNADMVGLLLDKGASAKLLNILGTSILEASIGMKRFQIVKKLIEGGADVDGTDAHQQPILIKVIRNPFLNNDEKVEVINMLVANGASPETVDIIFGLPAICHAVEMPSTPVVQALLSRAVNTNVRMLSGQTLLTYSIDVNRQNTVEALLAQGVDVNEVDGLNRTPLKLALMRLDYNLTAKLMDYGADPTAKENQEAVKFIRAVGRKDLQELLRPRVVEVGPLTPAVRREVELPTSEAPPPSYELVAGKV
ncbi:ankyrin protein [Fusarium pseudoanthophilum]|uniref:Ankyrin protein n=1 Tax=Fusarium pseudoanthophilum TaxID=48495 RepID=A0A8H5NU16_9HYPO|nr:ankyrin protein [Fusarium pseudoanthophilum]